MAAPERRIFTITIAPGWCDRRLPARFHWLSSLHATFGPKIFRHASRMIVYLIGK
jgi:hypothetical protein